MILIKRICGILFMVFALFPAKVYSQNQGQGNKNRLIDSILSTRGEAYLSIPVSQRKAFAPLLKSITPDLLTDSLLYFYVNAGEFRMVLESGLTYQVHTPPSMTGAVKMATGFDEILSGQAYPTYQQYLDLMQLFANNYPSICTIDTIGYSIKGKLILAARLQTGTYKEGDRPVVFYSSTMHGDEVVGYSLLLMLINDFLTNSLSSSRITAILNDMVVIINPLSNPDGAYFQSDTSLFGATRYNNQNIDLNRNFPDVLQGMTYTLSDVQKENSAMIHYMEKFRPSLSANFHTGAEVLNYPWDSWFSSEYKHADDSWFVEICKDYVDSARSVDSTYLRTFANGYVFGSDWYWIPRGRQDFTTYCLRGRELTIELSKIKLPDVSKIPGFWAKNHSALITLIEKAGYGIYGKITDSLTLEPVTAKVEIPGYDKNESYIYNSSASGKFFRYLPEGTYNLQVSAPGYLSKIISADVVKDQRTNLDVKLISIGSGISLKTIPGNTGLVIGLKGDDSQKFTAELYDLEGRKIRQWNFTGNSGTLEGTGFHGIYIIRIKSRLQSESQLVFFNCP